MLFKCYRCNPNRISFHSTCSNCGPQAQDDNVSLDPAYYPEFQYRPKGFFDKLFFKNKKQRELNEKLDIVLKKYRQLKNPYFTNYLSIARPNTDNPPAGPADNPPAGPDYPLFRSVLLHLGFDEINYFPMLTSKLIRSTSFLLEYLEFVNMISRHLSLDLDATLRSWIDEKRDSFRSSLPFLLYRIWEEKLFMNQIYFADQGLPIVQDAEFERVMQLCENIYFQIRVNSFKLRLEKFDPLEHVTMSKVDAMLGYEFEDFLGDLLTKIGYSAVEVTKRSGDQGADLIAERFGEKIVIQAKNYSDNVGNSAVQQVNAARSFYKCDRAMVICNRNFTPSAKDLAKSTGVELIDRNGLKEYLDQYNQAL